ncbi:MAG: DUF2062 domain-containing protein [Candidatus Omnitrophica bacterium]|nr:DUF2062 domain-containing protein [Candidatus Omnitrophota bacterium]
MIAKAKENILALLRLNNTPQQIALGLAVGVFIGITFPYGLHTLFAIIFSFLIPRTNKIAIIGGTCVSLPPTAPFIMWAGYEVGRFILQKGYPPLGWFSFKNITYQKALQLYWPVFVGSFFLGIFCAVGAYFVALGIVQRMKNKNP